MGCYTRALETYGQCTGCGADRLTLGRAADGGRLCTDCASIGDFSCDRCGREGRRYLRRICGNCVLTDRLAALLAALLADGTGAVRPELVPLLDGVGQMQRSGSESPGSAPHTFSTSCDLWPPAESLSPTTVSASWARPGPPLTCGIC
jgi:hypothetical protein